MVSLNLFYLVQQHEIMKYSSFCFTARNLGVTCDFSTKVCKPCHGLLQHYQYNEFGCPISCDCVHDPDMLFEGDIKLAGILLLSE